MAENKKELSFEEAIESLETIVEKLEEGEVPLEKALSFYQEGMKLSKICNDKLKHVQEEMVSIMDETGDLQSFDIQEEE